MMKNKIITALCIISAVILINAQQLIFKDKNFEKTVLENYDLNRDGKISISEAERVENLFLMNKGITSVEDVSYFKNARMIILDQNNIPRISLKNMDKVQLISCAGSKVAVFTAENLKSLTSLYLDGNQIENISLKSTPKINQLTVSLNKIKTIDVSALKHLKKLNLEHNLIQQLDISSNINLESLNIMKNPIREKDLKKGPANVTIFGFDQP
ncbi:leucine-rich repeat domain-containing protein [Chryseobacterium endophyticum]|uniref:Leucine-rich repeat domain-containing protein n=1 Tax=Chryseobacterium endophyticum TaxID=1854762 RepID=A0AAU6WPV6_9FLAO|nr:leucine-rich repeat domain-containing protein [uncultured Chryseobacterium sp.]